MQAMNPTIRFFILLSRDCECRKDIPSAEQCAGISLVIGMRAGLITIAACALLTLLGCGKQDADGSGGRTDPQSEQNDPAKRDAAPGSMSETSPPSTDEEQQQSPRQ